MAVLTDTELQARRRMMALDNIVTWTKAEINSAMQAAEDHIEAASTRNGFRGEINAAAPGVFSVAERDLITDIALRAR